MDNILLWSARKTGTFFQRFPLNLFKIVKNIEIIEKIEEKVNFAWKLSECARMGKNTK